MPRKHKARDRILHVIAGIAATALLTAAVFAFAFEHSPYGDTMPVTQTMAHRQAETSTNHLRVLIFFDPSRTDCAECALHTWRFAYYANQFEDSGAEVLGVVQGLRDGRPQLDDDLALPWDTIYDLSGTLAAYFSVGTADNHNPTVVIVDRDSRVIYRAQPTHVDDRLEGDILTTLLAFRDGLPVDTAPTVVARAR